MAFYYQNLFCVYVILDSLEDSIVKITIDCPLQELGINKEGEIDIVLEVSSQDDTENPKRFYEVKSGLEFTRNETEIKKAVLRLFEVFRRYHDRQSFYFLKVNPSYFSKIAEVISKIKKIQESKRKNKIFEDFCNKWRIKDKELFFNFCKVLEINTEDDLEKLEALCISKIEKYVKDLVFNINFAFTKEDLLNKFLKIILKSIQQNNGVIEIKDILIEFSNWCAINHVSYQTSQNHDPQKMISDAKKTFLREFQKYCNQPLEQEDIVTIISEQ